MVGQSTLLFTLSLRRWSILNSRAQRKQLESIPLYFNKKAWQFTENKGMVVWGLAMITYHGGGGSQTLRYKKVITH